MAKKLKDALSDNVGVTNLTGNVVERNPTGFDLDYTGLEKQEETSQVLSSWTELSMKFFVLGQSPETLSKMADLQKIVIDMANNAEIMLWESKLEVKGTKEC